MAKSQANQKWLESMPTVLFLWHHPRQRKRRRRAPIWWEMCLPIYPHRITSQTLFLLPWTITKMTSQRLLTCSTQFHHSKLQAAKSLRRLMKTVKTRMKEWAVRLNTALSCARSKHKSPIANLASRTENKCSKTLTRMQNSQLSCLPNAPKTNKRKKYLTSKRKKYLSIEFKKWDLLQRAITDQISLLKNPVANLLESLHVDQSPLLCP